MPFTKINTYSAGNPDTEALQETVDIQRGSYDNVVLTEWEDGNTAEPEISVGSRVDINGTLFQVRVANVAITGSPAAGTLYIKLGVVGTTVTPEWDTTAPTWDVDKGGWFVGADKYLPFVVDFDGVSAWTNKYRFTVPEVQAVAVGVDGSVLQESGVRSEKSQPAISQKIIDIGSWDMDANAQVNIAHGLTQSKIRDVSAIIQNDSLAFQRPIHFYDVIAGNSSGTIAIGSTNVTLTRMAGTLFDDPDFNDTGVNRGWIHLTYEA